MRLRLYVSKKQQVLEALSGETERRRHVEEQLRQSERLLTASTWGYLIFMTIVGTTVATSVMSIEFKDIILGLLALLLLIISIIVVAFSDQVRVLMWRYFDWYIK